MSGYNMECFVKDFARRTRINRGIVCGANGEHYEVTQLINSRLGLVIIPHEAFFDRIEDKKTELQRHVLMRLERLMRLLKSA